VLRTDGSPYVNTAECWAALNRMARDAVYLDLVPPEAYEDRRNAAPIIRMKSATPASTDIDNVTPYLGFITIDFDPGGMSMPVATARKIEFELHRLGIDGLDIEVRPVILTHDQCVEYRLPRIPIKETERRAGHFKERFGEGGTELDALEAIHPGELGRILLSEIERYWDPGHEETTAEVCRAIKDQVEDINEAVYDEHRKDIDQLKVEFDEIRKAAKAWKQRAEPLWEAIAERLEERAPDVEDVCSQTSWQADEDLNALYSSRRTYLDQIDHYKKHQGKTTERRGMSMSPTAVRLRRLRYNRRRERAAQFLEEGEWPI
jgi:hypothetical protein